MKKNKKFERTVITLHSWGEIGKIIRSDDYEYGMDEIKTIVPGQCLQLQYLLRSEEWLFGVCVSVYGFYVSEKNIANSPLLL